MLIVHARWVRNLHGHVRGLYLWAEDTKAYNNAMVSHDLNTCKKHPFAAPHKKLVSVLKKLAPQVKTHAGSLILALPSTHDAPLPSFPVTGQKSNSSALEQEESSPPVKQENSDPALWYVEAVILSPLDAIHFLSKSFEDTAKITWHPSFDYWRDVAQCSLNAVVNQSIMPELTYERSDWRASGWHATWRAELLDHELASISVLAHAMPKALSSVCYDAEKYFFAQPLDIMQDMVNSCIDIFVRSSLEDQKLSETADLAITNATFQEWLIKLTKKNNVLLYSSYVRVSTISQRLQEWQRIIPATKQLLQTVLTLSPLPLATSIKEEQSIEISQFTTEQPTIMAQPDWRIDLFVSPQADPSFMIPAHAVWDTDSHDYDFLDSLYAQPQKQLRGDLKKLANLFEPFQKTVNERSPEQVTISSDEALDFLQKIAPKLENHHIKLFMPRDFQEKQKKFTLKLYLKKPPTSSKRGMFDMTTLLAYDWRIALGDVIVSQEEFERLAALKQSLVYFRGQWIQMDQEQAQKTLDLIRKSAESTMGLPEALKLGYGQVDDTTRLAISGFDGDAWATEFLAQLQKPETLPLVATPQSFIGQLRPYQMVGLSWLVFLEKVGLGACLADDMGLGKTIQIIAWLLHKKELSQKTAHTGQLLNGTSQKAPDGARHSNAEKVLLICPLSVVGNWQKELQRFAPSLKVWVHHGAQRLSGNTDFASQASNCDLIITTYALAGRDKDMLSSIHWQTVIIDEAQNIKNHETKQTQAIKQLNASHKIALTGTPIENRLTELWSIMDFLNHGYLGGQSQFTTQFAGPIERYHDQDATERLKQLVAPAILRRVKTDKNVIKDLPEKIESKVYCSLSKEQATLYESVVKNMLQTIKEAEGLQRSGLIFSTLIKLKQICNHPVHYLKDQGTLEKRSGKLSRLGELLEEILAQGDKALIFTQFTEMGNHLVDYLEKNYKTEVLFLHGGTPKKGRDTMVEQFYNDPNAKLFVLSLKAGGIGLNLTPANHVFHFDRWWNPAVENQATDRAFRIGQHKMVQVHKFICSGTLEEKIDLMIEQKKELANLVVGGGEQWIGNLSNDQLENLFSLDSERAQGADVI